MHHQFVVMWDNQGLEFVGNWTEYSQDKMWSELQDKKPAKTFPSLMHLELRARYNTQRHYEIYLINAVEGITAEDIKDMFRNDPQAAADTIRELGHKYYSDRLATQKLQIT